MVHIPTSEFGVGEPLEALTSTVPTEVNPNTDTNEDVDENGIVNALGGVTSGVVTLTLGAEPLGDDVAGIDAGTPDDNSNLTVDFGFYGSMSLGDLVWLDIDNKITQFRESLRRPIGFDHPNILAISMKKNNYREWP